MGEEKINKRERMDEREAKRKKVRGERIKEGESDRREDG